MRWWNRWRCGLTEPQSSAVSFRRFRPQLECLEERSLFSVSASGFVEINLASDVPAIARTLDANLSNAWGLANSPTGPFWIAENNVGVSDLLDGRGAIVPLVVNVPAAPGAAIGAPTGVVFNGGPGFVVSANGLALPATFLFATEQGTIFGWNEAVDATTALPLIDNAASGAYYTGLTLGANAAGQTLLFVADFGRGTVEVYDQNLRPVAQPGAFVDPNLPRGFAPFNVENIGNKIYVTYAEQNPNLPGANLTGAGTGFVEVFDTDGKLLARLASGGPLNAPWGLTVAPAGFGPFGGDLLVGNNGDGRIVAYDPATGAYLGELADSQGIPIAIDGLWSLAFGNGHESGNSQTLFFTAGIANQTDGLFGAIQSPQNSGADTGAGGFDPHASGEPADYPLPPPVAPSFHDDSARRLPDAILVPWANTSLAMTPTLAPPRLSLPIEPAPATVAINASYASDETIVTASTTRSVSIESFRSIVTGDGVDLSRESPDAFQVAAFLSSRDELQSDSAPAGVAQRRDFAGASTSPTNPTSAERTSRWSEERDSAAAKNRPHSAAAIPTDSDLQHLLFLLAALPIICRQLRRRLENPNPEPDGVISLELLQE